MAEPQNRNHHLRPYEHKSTSHNQLKCNPGINTHGATNLNSFTPVKSRIGFKAGNADCNSDHKVNILYQGKGIPFGATKNTNDNSHETRGVKQLKNVNPTHKIKQVSSKQSCSDVCGTDWHTCTDRDFNYQRGGTKNYTKYCEDCYCCQDNIHRSQKPHYQIGVQVGSKRCSPQKFPPFFSSKYSSSRTLHHPLWTECCGKILTFHAYYQEPIPESALENYRIHQCNIHYYTDDGSFEVVERRTFDPGFPQGRLIRRHKIPYPPPIEDSFFQIEDIEVGCDVTFYGKTFHVCGCDEFTRKYLNRVLCTPVMPNQEMPDDPYTVHRQDQVTSLFARPARNHTDNDKGKKFLLNYNKVLRFWGYWDDRCNLGGVLRKFVIHYFLQDDTLEIRELAEPNSGLDNSPTFFQRGKLRKNVKDAVVAPDQKLEALYILNSTGGCAAFMDQTYLSDRLCPPLEEPDYYKDCDLAIGAVVNVYGRAFTLTDCDEFTKTYYREKYGLEDFTPLVIDEPTQQLPRMETPPHIGIGKEEDTRANWDKIELSPPKHSDLKHLTEDRDVLGFNAQFYNPSSNVNRDRRFVLQFYMADGCIQIFEKEHPNTGIKQGFFLSRSRVIKSGSWNEPNNPVEYFSPCDFFVGSILKINDFNFVLTEANEQTLTYMEQHSQLFPHSNICIILDKFKEIVGALPIQDLYSTFTQQDSCLQGVLTFDDFKALILALSMCSLSDHEILTLARSYQVIAQSPGPDWLTIQSIIHTELRKFNFDKRSLQSIEYTLRYHDPCRLGVVDRQHLNSAIKGARMPIDRLLIDYFVDKFPAADNCDRVNYCDVMKFFNWTECTAPCAKPSSLSCIMKHLECKPNPIFYVNYRDFLENIVPCLMCTQPLLSELECEEQSNSDDFVDPYCNDEIQGWG